MEKISAGPPSNTEGYIEKPLDLNTHLIKNELATFAVKVASLSMLNAGININDILIVDRSLTAKSEDIVVALVDNDFTVKRFFLTYSLICGLTVAIAVFVNLILVLSEPVSMVILSSSI